MKDGYYWVKRYLDSNWSISELDSGYFYFIGDAGMYRKDDIFIIGDYIETPDKYKDGK